MNRIDRYRTLLKESTKPNGATWRVDDYASLMVRNLSRLGIEVVSKTFRHNWKETRKFVVKFRNDDYDFRWLLGEFNVVGVSDSHISVSVPFSLDGPIAVPVEYLAMSDRQFVKHVRQNLDQVQNRRCGTRSEGARNEQRIREITRTMADLAKELERLSS